VIHQIFIIIKQRCQLKFSSLQNYSETADSDDQEEERRPALRSGPNEMKMVCIGSEQRALSALNWALFFVDS